jgi:hypothetical protein
MAVSIYDIYLAEIDHSTIVGGTMVIKTPIASAFMPLGGLPVSVGLCVCFDWKADDKSTVTCTVDLRDGEGKELGSGKREVSFAPGEGSATIPMSPCRITVTGTYTVRLYVDGKSRWSETIEISESR